MKQNNKKQTKNKPQIFRQIISLVVSSKEHWFLLFIKIKQNIFRFSTSFLFTEKEEDRKYHANHQVGGYHLPVFSKRLEPGRKSIKNTECNRRNFCIHYGAFLHLWLTIFSIYLPQRTLVMTKLLSPGEKTNKQKKSYKFNDILISVWKT